MKKLLATAGLVPMKKLLAIASLVFALALGITIAGDPTIELPL